MVLENSDFLIQSVDDDLQQLDFGLFWNAQVICGFFVVWQFASWGFSEL